MSLQQKQHQLQQQQQQQQRQQQQQQQQQQLHSNLYLALTSKYFDIVIDREGMASRRRSILARAVSVSLLQLSTSPPPPQGEVDTE